MANSAMEALTGEVALTWQDRFPFLQGMARFLRDLIGDKMALIGAIIVLLVILSAITAPYIAPYDPTTQDIRNRLQPPTWSSATGAQVHLLGTDQLGRDLLSRIIHGGRVSLAVALTVTAVAGGFGIFWGLVSGYFGGRVDDIIMRIVDVQTAFPGLLLAMAIITMIGPNIQNIIIVLSINGWMVYARIARGIMLALREMEYMQAARAIGCGHLRMIFRHALPNMVSPLITLATLEMARIILAEASLSFLGMGIQPPQASWGLMVAEGHKYITVAWWVIAFPGLAIAITVFGVNLVAAWLRTVTDPEQRIKRIAGVSGAS